MSSKSLKERIAEATSQIPYLRQQIDAHKNDGRNSVKFAVQRAAERLAILEIIEAQEQEIERLKKVIAEIGPEMDDLGEDEEPVRFKSQLVDIRHLPELRAYMRDASNSLEDL